MKLAVALQLGRISNLPTVWSNVLVGMTLAGAPLSDVRLPLVLVAMSLFYVAGMFLNDAFDREFDAKARPERPIPSGAVSATQVFTFGFGMMAVALALLLQVGYGFDGGTAWRPIAVGLALAVAIVSYDRWHKSNPLSPAVMGLCRMLLYVAAAFAVVHSPPASVYVAAGVLLCYLIGLTYAAKQEHLDRIGSIWPLFFLAVPVVYGLILSMRAWAAAPLLVIFAAWLAYALHLLRRRQRGDVARAVVSLIAGISLLDAVILAGHGALTGALAALACFVFTLVLQRWVSGT